ncbi:MAG TPA: cytochrome P450 [Candidatus Acidoferrum sp.]|nr:cytochrome P450 [Candidatus Acidoferrum sp.]
MDHSDSALSLFQLLDPAVVADPYPLYRRLRSEDPVHWDPFLHAWVVTSYADVVTVLLRFSARATPTPEHLQAVGLSALTPVAQVMVRQMLFMDAPAHTRIRGLASQAFTPRRVERLRAHIQDIVDGLLDRVAPAGRMDVIGDFANPLPAIVSAEMLGVPTSDHQQLKIWSADFAEALGAFQHDPERAVKILKATEEMIAYFQSAILEQRRHPHDGLIHAFMTAEIDGDRLTDDEVVANCIITMVGGQETTTNLIGNGILTLLRNPSELARVVGDATLIPSTVEELLRYESPSQQTTRIAPEDLVLGGKHIRAGQAVIAVMGAANRDPERFPDPDRLDVARTDNRHLAFGWASHFCFGAPLARLEGQIAFATILRRLANLQLEPEPLMWRSHLALRGLTALHVRFDAAAVSAPRAPVRPSA